MSPLVAEPGAVPSAPKTAPVDQIIKDVDVQTFVKDAIEESRRRLVIIDFWAPWSGPCKQLVPLLEKLVRAKKGAVLLAKVNIDTNPELAQQMHVRSVPTVFAFFQGQPVDGFMGVQPEPQLVAWIDQLIKATGSQSPLPENYDAALKQAAELLETGDAARAEAIYGDIYAEKPDHAEAFAGVLRCMIARDAAAEAQVKLNEAPKAIAQDKALDSVRAALELALASDQAGDCAPLESKLAKNPDDHQTRFDLAMAYYAVGDKEKAVDALLEIVRRDRAWNEEAARKQLVKFFEAFGFADPLSVSGRRRLSSLLFS